MRTQMAIINAFLGETVYKQLSFKTPTIFSFNKCIQKRKIANTFLQYFLNHTLEENRFKRRY